jgi:hypothetical protein
MSYGSFDAVASELLAGRVDAIVTLIGAPVPAVQEAEAKEPVILKGEMFAELPVQQGDSTCEAGITSLSAV